MDLNPWPFSHRSGTLTTDQGCYWCSNHWAILLPQGCSHVQRYNTVVCSPVKIACMCFSAVNGSGPAYLSELLHVYTPSRSCTLRSSSDTCILKIQYKHKTHGFRTFFCFGPHIWNSLPQNLRHCCHLLKSNWKPSSLHSISTPTNISTQFLLQSLCVCVCVCARVHVFVCVCVCLSVSI